MKEKLWNTMSDCCYFRLIEVFSWLASVPYDIFNIPKFTSKLFVLTALATLSFAVIYCFFFFRWLWSTRRAKGRFSLAIKRQLLQQEASVSWRDTHREGCTHTHLPVWLHIYKHKYLQDICTPNDAFQTHLRQHPHKVSSPPSFFCRDGTLHHQTAQNLPTH